MKTILIIFNLLFSLSLFSQTVNQVVLTQNLNYNRITQPGHMSSGIWAQQSMLSAYSYDTVREITELNDPSNADAYPWISSDGLRLYYTSGANGNSLAYTQRVNPSSYFAAPVIIPVSISNPSSYWLSNNELDVYICNDSLYFAHRNSVTSPFSNPVLINLIQPFNNLIYRGASLDNSQNTLFISAYNGSYLGLLEFTRTTSNSFSYVRTLPYPAGYTVEIGQLSKDELTMFLSASTGFGLTQLYQLSRSHPTDSFSIGTFQQIQNINNSAVNNIQPSMSDHLDWVAFVRSSQNLWQYDDLFIAHKGKEIMSVFNLNENNSRMIIFPNPATQSFTIRFNKFVNDAELYICDIRGRIVKSIEKISGESVFLQCEKISNGVYFVRLKEGDIFTPTDKLLITDN